MDITEMILLAALVAVVFFLLGLWIGSMIVKKTSKSKYMAGLDPYHGTSSPSSVEIVKLGEDGEKKVLATYKGRPEKDLTEEHKKVMQVYYESNPDFKPDNLKL